MITLFRVGHTQNDLGVITVESNTRTLNSLIDCDGFHIRKLPDLSQRGIVILEDERGLDSTKPLNENMFPFFFVGTVLFVKSLETSSPPRTIEFVSLTPKDIGFVDDWLKGLPL